jgi:hypothetical protein
MARFKNGDKKKWRHKKRIDGELLPQGYGKWTYVPINRMLQYAPMDQWSNGNIAISVMEE